MKQIRICHLVYSFDEIGGLENGLINIINYLDPRVFHHTICALTRCGGIKNRVSNKDVTYISLNKKEGNDIRIPFILAGLLRKHKINVIHLRNWATMVEGFVAAKLSGTRGLIYSEHGRHFEEIDSGSRLKYRVKQFIFKTVPLLLTVSTEVEKEMRSLYRLDRPIRVIRNGVDSSRFRPVTLGQNQFSGSPRKTEPVFGTVCRLVKGKNLIQLINTFADAGLKAKLVIIGDGPERKDLEQLIHARGCGDRIQLLGNREDVPELLNRLDVFIQPSESEGLSNVVIEAMACGLPVIAFDIGGNRELIHPDKGGFLIDLYDMKTFLIYAEKLGRDQSRAQAMGRYNREKILTSFSIDQMVKAYSGMYKDLSTL